VRPRWRPTPHQTVAESQKEKNMNSKTWTRIVAVVLLAVLARPIGLVAQDHADGKPGHHHYKLIDVGTFGGPK
jgi:hypothetical protein